MWEKRNPGLPSPNPRSGVWWGLNTLLRPILQIGGLHPIFCAKSEVKRYQSFAPGLVGSSRTQAGFRNLDFGGEPRQMGLRSNLYLTGFTGLTRLSVIRRVLSGLSRSTIYPRGFAAAWKTLAGNRLARRGVRERPPSPAQVQFEGAVRPRGQSLDPFVAQADLPPVHS